MATEDDFRTTLATLATRAAASVEFDAWSEWDTCRRMFADYLEERGSPEAAFALGMWC